jgi:hypothetical protein
VTSVTQFGVTFTFSADVPGGQFADGSWYVIAPVTIAAITPDWNGTINGAEANPLYGSAHGFDARKGGYSAALNICTALPYAASAGQTIVKTVGGVSVDTSFIKTAVPLTILASEPAGGGSAYFRPPYCGTEKPLIATASIRTHLLPDLAPAGTPPTLAAVQANFAKCLRMDHHSSDPRWFRPQDAMTGYQPNNTRELNEAMLRLLLSDSINDRLPAMIQFTQHALDRAYVIKQGYTRWDNGHNPNHRVLAAWAAYFLDLTDVATYLSTATGFHEDVYLYDGTPGALWGEGSTEGQYWNYVMGLGGSRSNRDPYGFIDGGELSSGSASYQWITSQSLKGQALVYDLVPGIAALCPASRIATLKSYANRWVTLGSWAVPDPVAPFDGNVGNYGITFGPNGSGSYIAGAGRWPSSHAAGADGGQYKSAFVGAMWGAHYEGDGSEPPPDPPPSGTASPLGNRSTRFAFAWGF